MITSTRTSSFASRAAVLLLAVTGGCAAETTSDLSSAATVVADSLVTNASFENGLTGWSNWYGSTARSTSRQRSGTGCLKIGASGGAEIQDVTARLQVGHTYHLSGYVRLSSASQVNNAAIGMYGTDSAGNAPLNGAAGVTSYSSSYQAVSMDFTYPANLVQTYVYAQLQGGTGAAVYVDDLQLVDMSSSSQSPNGTTIPPASQIVDDQSHVWTVTSGVVYENGTTAAYSANVTQLLYYNGVIYQENAAGGWWSWTGSAWADATDPRGGSGSGSGSGSGGGGGSTVTISADWDTYNYQNGGPFWAMNSTWNNSGLTNGVDYTQTISMNTGTFPNGTAIAWSWPNTPASGNVYSYPAVFYGTYQAWPSPAISIPAKQINNISALQLSFNLTLGGSLQKYDAIFDMYLKSTPGQNNGAFEVEIDVHTPTYFSDWVGTLSQSHYTDSQGLAWTIASNPGANPPMILFVPSDFRDLTNYTVDFKALLNAAKNAGLITGNEYFDGLALGNEPQMGSGSMTINSFSVNYQ